MLFIIALGFALMRVKCHMSMLQKVLFLFMRITLGQGVDQKNAIGVEMHGIQTNSHYVEESTKFLS